MTYVYNYNLDILGMAELLDTGRSAVEKAIGVLSKFSEADRAFEKLLYGSPTMGPLNGKHFKILTIATNTITSIYELFMSNYVVTENPSWLEFSVGSKHI